MLIFPNWSILIWFHFLDNVFIRLNLNGEAVDHVHVIFSDWFVCPHSLLNYMILMHVARLRLVLLLNSSSINFNEIPSYAEERFILIYMSCLAAKVIWSYKFCNRLRRGRLTYLLRRHLFLERIRRWRKSSVKLSETCEYILPIAVWFFCFQLTMLDFMIYIFFFVARERSTRKCSKCLE